MPLGDINTLFQAQKIASSGLRANRTWMNLISNNIANANTIDVGELHEDGNYKPYARQVPVFAKVLAEEFRAAKINGDVKGGVIVKDVIQNRTKVRKVYDPCHPAARRPGSRDAGYVYYPAISIPQEMADLKVAAAAYEANIALVSVDKNMIKQALLIGK